METIVTNKYTLKHSVSMDDQTSTKTVTLHWTIPKFSVILQNNINWEINTDKITDFKKDFDESSKIQLSIKTLGKRGQVVEVYYLAPRPMFSKISMNMSFPNLYGQNQQIANLDYHWVQARKWQVLTDLLRSNINFNTLEFQIQFMINVKAAKSTEINKVTAKLNNDFENLLNNPMFSDVILKSIEGVDFPAHKGVLAARSAVLKAHFDHEMAETSTNTVESLLDSDILREVLLYIYTGTVPKLNEMSEELLKAADYYELNELKHLCEKQMQDMLTVENVLAVLQLAHSFSAGNLENSCIQFINDNDAKAIIKTEGWEVIDSELYKTIAEFLIQNN